MDIDNEQPTDEVIDSETQGTADPSSQEQAAPSMDDTLRTALAGIKARGEEGATQDGDTSADESVGEPPAGMVRDPATGRFVKKPQAADPKSTVAPVIDPKTGKAAEPANTNPDNLEHVGHDGKRYVIDISKAPSSFRADAKALFEQAPEALRREIYKRENDFHRGLSESRTWAGIGQALHKEIAPYEALIRSKGIHAEKVVGTLLGNAYTFATGSPEEKAALVLEIIDQYGITGEAIQKVNQRRSTGKPAVDPQFAGVRKELDEVKGKLRSAEEQREQAAQADANDQAERFLADPKNEFVQEVSATMTELLRKGLAKDLPEAYDKACRLTPAVAAKISAKQQEAERKRRADEAASARKAASANVNRRGTPPDITPKGTIEDTARAALRVIRARSG